MSKAMRVAVGLATVLMLTVARSDLRAEAQQTGEAAPPGWQLVDRYCVTCHNDRLETGGLTLEGIDLERIGDHASVLERVVHKLRSGQMPPQGRPRPDAAVMTAFVADLERELDRASAAEPNPGTVALHRLNRTEYVNAIRDLFALDVDAEALLPADLLGLGFDNNADVLTVTSALMARYMSAATKVSRLAVGSASIRPTVQVYQAPEYGRQDRRMNELMPFATHGGLAVNHTFPLDGEYGFKIRLQRNRVGNTIRGIDTEQEIEVRLDHALVERFTIGGKYPGTDPGILIAIPEDEVEAQRLHTYRLTADDELELRVPVTAGTHLVTVAFADTTPAASESIPLIPRSIRLAYFSDDAGDPGIDTLDISGPYAGSIPETSPSRERIFVCYPSSPGEDESCANQIVATLARRAFRRPVTDEDTSPLMEVFRNGRAAGGFEAGIERMVEALLVSPQFVLRAEAVPPDARPGDVHRLSDIDLASRLSFFLWSSIPDHELLDVAERGELRDPTVLEQQVRRMLVDGKASALIQNFFGQWLITRNALQAEPDPARFPDFDDTLRTAMVRETELFVESLVREDRSVLDLLRADYTFLNERLAEHYGVPGVYGNHFRRVRMDDESRRGILGHASVLTVTSYAHRTSVVLRGHWVLETLLGAPPPPPPPNVPPLEEDTPGGAPTSLREKMERHRASPTCAACHLQMDPLGFALENFDATGRWRETDGGAPIEQRVTMPDGSVVEGPGGFRDALLARQDELVQTVVEKLMTYALSRGVEYYDMPVVREIVRNAERDDFRWSSVILGIVESRPFVMRRVPGETTPQAAAAQE